MEIDREYLGQLLLQQGFKTWFLYTFRVLEGRPFKIEPIHDDMFKLAEDILSQRITRAIENVPPRSAKTTMCKYIVLYTFTVNPRANFIYTSFNQGLLADISKELAALMEHPIYKAMYPQKINYEYLEASPVDDFWRDYFQQQKKDKENIYTNRRITTAQGGSILFAAIGSQITGYGAGIRGGKGFSGALIIDDANKPADIYSQTMRDKVLRYFEETLLSRLNDSDVLIFNVQQRLHIEDLSGHLKRKYGYYMLSKPLLDINGVCQIPSQYTPDRIAELQHDESMFQAQYQQEPTAEKGRIIKREWWRYYNPDETPLDGQIIITADTAFKETKTADYSCIQTWELKKDRMNMRDMVVGKWEFPELIQYAKQMWEKWTDPNKINRAKYFFIEDKASGTPLQQTLANEGINAIAWRPQDFDYPENKVARTKTLSWDVFRNLVYLPEGERMTEYLVNEASLFAEDMSHSHDDSVDSASMAHSVWKYYGGGQD
jgi:predicted phage terminase large subunit-like protein